MRTIDDFRRLLEKKVIAVATSAVAALLLDEGRTAHSTSNMLIPSTAESTCNIFARQEHVDTDFIIWHEIFMGHRFCVHGRGLLSSGHH